LRLFSGPASFARVTVAVVLGAAAGFGCGDGERPRGGIAGQPPVPGFTLSEAEPGVVDLSAWFDADSELVGVAVDEAGIRYVLDAANGLYRLGTGGARELVLDARTLEQRYGISRALELSDVVAYGPDRFLVTASDDGFLLDLWAGTFASYFCYLPPIDSDEAPAPVVSVSQELQLEGIPVTQRTESVAYNTLTGEIFAQPQTRRLDLPNGEVAGSELFVFSGTGGQPLSVQPLADLQFSAGGMIARDNRLLLGSGHALYELSGPDVHLIRTLEDDLVITGMALDRDDSLLVLDGPGRRLFDLHVFLRL